MTLPHVSDDQRRARLVHRQLLGGAGPTSAEDISAALLGLHATTASTVHLSAWARNPAISPEAVEAALYERRTLVKQLCMRRTLFVLTRPQLAAAVGAVGLRVAASERTNMLRDLRREDGPADPEGWIEAAAAAVVERLDGRMLTSSQLRAELPDLDISIEIARGKAYGGPSPMLPRMLNHLAARGLVVRGESDAPWHQSRPRWTSMRSWLGEELPSTTAADGHRQLIEGWLRTYGPGTETDLVWWLGSTKTAVRAALAELEVAAVALDSGETGYLMADDLAEVDAPEPRALLLPALDPTIMGYKQRDFYLGDYAADLFDATGNGGQSAWWDGRIVGGWVQHAGTGQIEVVPLESLPAGATAALAARADELRAWFGEARPVVGFPSPMMRERGRR